LTDQQGRNAYAEAKSDERRGSDAATPRVDHSWVVLRHVNDLRIGGLNGVDGLARVLLHIHLLLLVAA
jgi:hypothetical protein